MKNKRKIGIGPEGKLHKNFAQCIFKYEFYKKTDPSLVWSYSGSGEKRSMATGALLKAKGLRKGFPDYHFKVTRRGISHNIWLEFKAGKNQQTLEQKEFQNRCEMAKNEAYYLVRSVEEGIRVLEKEEILKIN
jgi:hypothetical protein